VVIYPPTEHVSSSILSSEYYEVLRTNSAHHFYILIDPFSGLWRFYATMLCYAMKSYLCRSRSCFTPRSHGLTHAA
jgi:hypothetical protein